MDTFIPEPTTAQAEVDDKKQQWSVLKFTKYGFTFDGREIKKLIIRMKTLWTFCGVTANILKPVK